MSGYATWIGSIDRRKFAGEHASLAAARRAAQGSSEGYVVGPDGTYYSLAEEMEVETPAQANKRSIVARVFGTKSRSKNQGLDL